MHEPTEPQLKQFELHSKENNNIEKVEYIGGKEKFYEIR